MDRDIAMPGADYADRKRTTVEFLQLLAKAARQFRTYPPTSALCTDAVEACHKTFLALRVDEPLAVRITSQHLLLDDEPVEADSAVEQELRRPLHASHVGSIEFDRGTAARDWTQFCLLVAAARRGTRDTATFAERLMDAGVNAIVPRMTPRPEVLTFPHVPDATGRLIAFERTRQAAATPGAPAQYLYPPDKGWVRLDPSAEDPSVSLVDLTLLVGDPGRLASVLSRLVDDAVDEADARDPLRDRYDDVVMLIGAIEPHLGRTLMAKLARAVLDLDVDRRRALLRRSILPHLLDGRAGGDTILAEFPDVELADALGLLFDLEMASPQLLPIALDRLQLAPDRRARLMPLVDAAIGGRLPADRWSAAGFDERAKQLVQVNADVPRQFADFAAFDLAIDDSTRAALADARTALGATDTSEVTLGLLVGLVRLEPSPLVASSLLDRALPLLQGYVRDERWPDATRWLARISDLAGEVDAARPEVAVAIRAALGRFCDRQTLLRIANLFVTDAAQTYTPLLFAALGSAVVPPWLDALASPADRAAAMRLRPVMCQCAIHTAPPIAASLADLRPDVAIAAVTVLGYAGHGHEAAIAALVTGSDEALDREALRALARIASPRSAILITLHIEHGGRTQPAAEEALWRLPAPLAQKHARDLLCRREFIARWPQAATRLLERVAHSGSEKLEPVLESLAPLRFHFWNPAVARVGAKARGLM